MLEGIQEKPRHRCQERIQQTHERPPGRLEIAMGTPRSLRIRPRGPSSVASPRPAAPLPSSRARLAASSSRSSTRAELARRASPRGSRTRKERRLGSRSPSRRRTKALMRRAAPPAFASPSERSGEPCGRGATGARASASPRGRERVTSRARPRRWRVASAFLPRRPGRGDRLALESPCRLHMVGGTFAGVSAREERAARTRPEEGLWVSSARAEAARRSPSGHPTTQPRSAPRTVRDRLALDVRFRVAEGNAERRRRANEAKRAREETENGLAGAEEAMELGLEEAEAGAGPRRSERFALARPRRRRRLDPTFRRAVAAWRSRADGSGVERRPGADEGLARGSDESCDRAALEMRGTAGPAAPASPRLAIAPLVTRTEPRLSWTPAVETPETRRARLRAEPLSSEGSRAEEEESPGRFGATRAGRSENVEVSDVSQRRVESGWGERRRSPVESLRSRTSETESSGRAFDSPDGGSPFRGSSTRTRPSLRTSHSASIDRSTRHVSFRVQPSHPPTPLDSRDERHEAALLSPAEEMALSRHFALLLRRHASHEESQVGGRATRRGGGGRAEAEVA